MATHEHPPNFGMIHGCPTPPPTASSLYGPPRFLSPVNHTPPMCKRTGAGKPLHTPPLEFTPIGQGHQFRFTRAQSIERSSRPSSTSGHAYAGTTLQETEYEESSDEESEEEDERPMRRVEQADFELEEVDSGESGDEDIEVVKPDHCEDAKSDKSGAALEETGFMDRMRELHVSEGSADEEAKERIYLRKKKKWGQGRFFKRTHDESVEGDSSYSDEDPTDDNSLEARRLRRKLRQPGGRDRRGPLIFEDKGFPNTNNIQEVKEPEEGVVKHTRGPPSIPSDDAFTMDELPFWRGHYDTMEVETDPEL